MSKFAQNLRILRERNGISQKALAIRMEYSVNEVQLWETGRVEPRLSAIMTVINTFHVQADDLLINDMNLDEHKHKGVINETGCKDNQ